MNNKIMKDKNTFRVSGIILVAVVGAKRLHGNRRIIRRPNRVSGDICNSFAADAALLAGMPLPVGSGALHLRTTATKIIPLTRQRMERFAPLSVFSFQLSTN